jgi:hydroxyacylglutathione hydrolase
MKLERDLYAYLWQSAYENNCNTYLIRGEVTVLIDPGHSRHLPHLFHQMEGDGVSPEEIGLVIVTHSHPDHFEGLEVFKDKPVKIAMNHEEERYLMENGKLLFDMMGQPMPEFRVNFYLKEGELYWGKETGDLVFLGGVGRTDFLGGDSKLIKDSIERMSHLDTELLLPGHGEMVMGKERVLQNFELIRQSLYAYL